MAIKIFIPLTVQIEDKSFLIEAREATSTDVEEIDKVAEDASVAQKKIVKIYGELTVVEEDMRINAGLIDAEASLVEKGKLWLEQRALAKEKKRLNALLKEQPETIDFREAFKKRFELLVRGEGKTTLEEEMKKYNISYKQVLEEIDDLLSKEKKKK